MRKLFACAAAGMICASANADPFSLTNGGGIADGDTGPAGTATGATDLLSDFGGATGVGTAITDHLFEERIFVDDGTGTVEITALPRSGEVVTGTTVDVTYTAAGSFEVVVSLDLAAPDMLTENITLRALAAGDFRLWEFTDFDVGGTAGDDNATFNGPGDISQVDDVAGFQASVVVNSPAPTAWQIGAFADGIPAAILAGTDLTNADTGPAPGDNAFAYQWDVTLAAAEELIIDKTKSYGTPPPGACCLCDGMCVDGLSRLDCEAQDGDFQGEGSDCAGTFCSGGAPANDDCATGAELLTVGVASAGTTVCATADGAAPSCGAISANDVHYLFASTAGVTYEVTLANTSTTTDVAVYDACGGTEVACGEGTDFVGIGGGMVVTVSTDNTAGGGSFEVLVGVVPGACCLPDVCGACEILSPDDCSAMGGTFQGASTDCATGCPPPANGACCLNADTLCVDTCEADCTAQGGTYLGDGTECGPLGFGDSEGMGDWTVTVFDDAGGDTGTFDGITLDLNDGAEVAFVSGLGLVIDSAGTNPQTATVNIPNSITVTNVQIGVDLEHTFADDLEISLTGPTGIVVNLSFDRGGTGELGDPSTSTTATYTFSDDGVGTWDDQGDPIPAGDYQPETPLNAGPAGNCATGACVIATPCNDDCSLQTPLDCAALGGTFLGVQVACPDPDPTGACQLPDICNDNCIITCDADCTAQGGTYLGDDTTCPAGDPTGACTLPSICNDVCIITCAADCAAQSGTYLGDDSSCPAGDPTGACCLVDSCVLTCAADCAAQSGAYLGDGTDCGNAGFGGTEAMGDWTLDVVDDAGGDPGLFGSWSLNINGMVFSSGALNLNFDDSTPVSDTINVPSAMTVTSVEVTVGLAHEFAADVVLTVTGPTGVSVLLTDDLGGGNYLGDTGQVNFGDPFGNPVDYVFADGAGQNWSDPGVDPVPAGTYEPIESLNASSLGNCALGACVIASACNDNCSLQTEDACNTAGGTFLGVQSACPAPDALGACCLPDDICTITCENDCDTQGGQYAGDDTTCDGGFGGSEAMGDWTILVEDDAALDPGTFGSWSLNINGMVFSSGALNLPFDDVTPQMDTINVPTSMSITTIEVTVGLAHEFADDVRVTVTGPNGVSRLLTENLGGANYLGDTAGPTGPSGNPVDYVFVDGAGQNFDDPGVDPVPAGNYEPIEALSLADPCANLNEPCDLEPDGDVDINDLLAFLSLWFAADPGSDFNGDGTFMSGSGTGDINDLLAFLACYFANQP